MPRVAIRTTLPLRTRLVFAGFLCVLGLSSRGLAAPQPAADHSLTAQDYQAAGMPGIDKPWLGGDYRKAAEVLNKIAAKDPTQLPRFLSKTSGDVFARLTSARNLDSLKGKYNDPQAAMGEFRDMMSAVLAILTDYLNASHPNGVFDSEVMNLCVFDLKVSHNALILAADRFTDKQYAESVLKMKTGVAITIGGAIQMLTDRDFLRSAEAVRTAGELQTLVPQLFPLLTPDGQKTVRSQLQTSMDSTKDPEVKLAIQRIADKLPK